MNVKRNAPLEPFRHETQSKSSGVGAVGVEFFAFLLVEADLNLFAFSGCLADFRELLLTDPALGRAAVVKGKNLRAGLIVLEINIDVAPSRVVVNAHYQTELLSGRRLKTKQARRAATPHGKKMAAFGFSPCAARGIMPARLLNKGQGVIGVIDDPQVDGIRHDE